MTRYLESPRVIVPPEVLAPYTGQEWLRHFERFAERIAREHQEATGFPLPRNQGFSATAGRAAK